MALKRILAVVLALVLSNVLLVALPCSAHAQHHHRVLVHAGRFLGVGWGNGYHVRNPGSATGYYSPYTSQNSTLIAPGNQPVAQRRGFSWPNGARSGEGNVVQMEVARPSVAVPRNDDRAAEDFANAPMFANGLNLFSFRENLPGDSLSATKFQPRSEFGSSNRARPFQKTSFQGGTFRAWPRSDRRGSEKPPVERADSMSSGFDESFVIPDFADGR